MSVASAEHRAQKGGDGLKGMIFFLYLAVLCLRQIPRLKAKRVSKRKTKPTVQHEEPPSKRPRISQPPLKKPVPRSAESDKPKNRPPTQIISSLFTSNPIIEKPTPSVASKKPSQPSNAPLADSNFLKLGLNPLLATHLTHKMGISKPTSIQRAVLSAALDSDTKESLMRDIFIQSQTGSGKTLSFLLPIIQDLLPLSSLSYIDRSIGTLAVIIAPTRELASQISQVLESLLKMRLRSESESADDPNATRLTRWLVSGLLIGGATRTHEKARLRKGVPILVSTPGRLLDHLQNTSSFNVGKCRWLVLDEADRLMELGFEETISGIISGLDGRQKLALEAVEQGISSEVGGWDWKRRRRTILCSATIREDVQKLAGMALQNPVILKATESEALEAKPTTAEHFTPPSQLSQKYVVVPLKLRLVVLVSLLRSLVAQRRNQNGTRIIVFFSCTDTVDFHWRLLSGAVMEGSTSHPPVDEDSASESGVEDTESVSPETIAVRSPLVPESDIFRLHGSLPTQTRLATVKQFADPSKTSASSILFCTSVASRGLDLPLVGAVVQYDLPTEGGAVEYVHRVGRTARAGKGGEAWSILTPSESVWVDWVEKRMAGQDKAQTSTISIAPVSVETVLQGGFGGRDVEYEERATEVQLALERWVVRRKDASTNAKLLFACVDRLCRTRSMLARRIFPT